MASTGKLSEILFDQRCKSKRHREFYEVIRKMIGSFRDAHTRVYAPEEKFDWWSPRFVS